MYFKFEKLEVWQLSRVFVSDIYKLTKKFPKDELFGLTSQVRRAAISVSLNIAEGSSRHSDLDFKHFLFIARGSLEEVIAALYIALDQKIIDQKGFEDSYNSAQNLEMKMNAFIKTLARPAVSCKP